MSEKISKIPRLDFNVNSILNKADQSNDMLTYESSLSGRSYIVDKSGGVMILDGHGFYRAQWEDMQVICEEMRAWIIPEAERWQKS